MEEINSSLKFFVLVDIFLMSSIELADLSAASNRSDFFSRIIPTACNPMLRRDIIRSTGFLKLLCGAVRAAIKKSRSSAKAEHGMSHTKLTEGVNFAFVKL